MAVKISVKATVTMPVSVTCSGNVLRPNDVAESRNGLRNHYRNHLLLYFLCLTLLILSGCASLRREMVLAVVDGEPVTEEDLKYSLQITHRREDLSSADVLNLSQYVHGMVDDKLIIDEARRMSMDQYPEVKQAIQAYILRESVVRLHDEEIVKKVTVSEKNIIDYYKKDYERFTLGLIEAGSEEDAKDILKKLKMDKNFKELAQK